LFTLRALKDILNVEGMLIIKSIPTPLRALSPQRRSKALLPEKIFPLFLCVLCGEYSS
jgi:hypothetical protein